VGSHLVLAVRRAAHTRGARALYAIIPAKLIDYFSRLGFAGTTFAQLDKRFDRALMPQPSSSDPTACRAVCLDLSREGILER
jgi:N-acetylglutamate synthase-like GNAT family acetyltransferase